MDNNEAADYLENYNNWRRDNNVPSEYTQPQPKKLGEVIDLVVAALRHTENIKNDAINPDHYKIGGIKSIDYMKAKSTPEELKGFLRLTALKYLSRYGKKDNTLQEVKKAKWYIERLISELENED